MKKTYTKKQIQEAIRFWKNRLRRLDETAAGNLESLKAAWIDPESDGEDIKMRPCGIRLEHAGRYSLEIRQPDMFPSEFGRMTRPDEDGKRTSMLYATLISPDVNYYYGDLQFKSRPAYDAALLREALAKQNSFDSAADAFADVFGAMSEDGIDALAAIMKNRGVTAGEGGSLVIDELDGVIGELTIFPL